MPVLALAAVFGLSGMSEAGGPRRGAGARRPMRARGLRGSRRGPGGREQMRRMAPGQIMPSECPDFESALGAWNTFYKRSLFATRGGKQGIAKRPLGKSREAWYQILWRYYKEPPAEYAKDEHWGRDLAAITGHLHLAEWLAASGQMKEAHEALEPVRRIWMEIRERNGVRWFGDELTRFHDVMEPVVLWGTGQTHGGVTEENIEEFEGEVAALVEAWRKVGRFGFRPRMPRGPGGQLQYRIFMTQAAEAIGMLRMVVEERYYDEIAEAAGDVKKAFVPVYMNFG